ncbi:hypothetical protein EXIGLDRAFT_734151 [Exidia glandulosa HHB12029]|uniref:Uncharacterized protein n=1 Tax=Exidia glandulosa HHB12029 TaxID=1314781 RepID=A0A165B592_EXIGL|nr:hypothetical protein EXIGLDRAFT_734151 [Exidia glandulosa HHB12029]
MQRSTSYIPRLRYSPRHPQAAYRRRACVARVRASSAALRPSGSDARSNAPCSPRCSPPAFGCPVHLSVRARVGRTRRDCRSPVRASRTVRAG